MIKLTTPRKKCLKLLTFQIFENRYEISVNSEKIEITFARGIETTFARGRILKNRKEFAILSACILKQMEMNMGVL